MSTGKRKCYVSGKITGLPINEAIKNFNKASLHAMFLGYDVVNPLNIEPDGDEPKSEKEKWSWFMRSDIKEMMNCDVILMQDNWEDSKGATIEHNLAKSLDFTVIYMNSKRNSYLCKKDIINSNNKEVIEDRKIMLLLFFFFLIIFLTFLISYLFK